MEFSNEEFIGQREASRRFGISMMTLRRRIERGDLHLFRKPLDDRVRLLRVSDLERLSQPVRVDEPDRESTAGTTPSSKNGGR